MHARPRGLRLAGVVSLMALLTVLFAVVAGQVDEHAGRGQGISTLTIDEVSAVAPPTRGVNLVATLNPGGVAPLTLAVLLVVIGTGGVLVVSPERRWRALLVGAPPAGA